MGAVSNVVAFPVAAVSTFDQGWDCRQGQMKRRGDGKEKTRKLWNKAAKVIGQDRLLAALGRYLKEEKEPSCGYPGLSVWLNGERWDHWLPDPTETIRLANAPVFPEPMRTAVLAATSSEWVRSYLDPCIIIQSPNGPLLQPKTDYARRKLMEHAGLFKSLGLYGIRRTE